MWITKARHALFRCFLGFGLAGVASAGCGDKKESSEQGKTQAPADPAGSTATSPKEPATKVDEPAPDLASMDVSFLVAPCIESGLAEDACKCAGEEAKTTIGHVILAKMSKAPADTDPAIKKYYSVAEMQKIVTWVDSAGIKCGLEEEE